jgi:hypothetical protein
MSMYRSLFTVPIPVNYTSEFQELFEATIYIYVAAKGQYFEDAYF